MRCTPLPDRAEILSTGAAPRKARRSPDAGQDVVAVVGRHQVPLVQHDDGRAARDADALGQPLVLVRRPDGGVDDQDGDVGPLQRPQARASSACCSVPRSVLDGRRSPAVSMKRTGPSGVSTTVSMASRVVPGMSCTIERSSPSSWLKSVDLPTLGRPMMATLRRARDRCRSRPLGPPPAPSAVSSSSSSRRERHREQRHDLVEQVAGPPPVQRAHRIRDRPGRARRTPRPPTPGWRRRPC